MVEIPKYATFDQRRDLILEVMPELDDVDLEAFLMKTAEIEICDTAEEAARKMLLASITDDTVGMF